MEFYTEKNDILKTSKPRLLYLNSITLKVKHSSAYANIRCIHQLLL